MIMRNSYEYEINSGTHRLIEGRVLLNFTVLKLRNSALHFGVSLLEEFHSSDTKKKIKIKGVSLLFIIPRKNKKIKELNSFFITFHNSVGDH